MYKICPEKVVFANKNKMKETEIVLLNQRLELLILFKVWIKICDSLNFQAEFIV